MTDNDRTSSAFTTLALLLPWGITRRFGVDPISPWVRMLDLPEQAPREVKSWTLGTDAEGADVLVENTEAVSPFQQLIANIAPTALALRLGRSYPMQLDGHTVSARRIDGRFQVVRWPIAP